MFESAFTRTETKRRGRWSILPLSGVVHLIALAAVVSAQYWNIGPVAEPQVGLVFFEMSAPPPMPPGGGGGGTPPPPEEESAAPEPEPQPQTEVVVPETMQPVPELVEREVPAPTDVVTPVALVDLESATGSHRTGGGPWTGTGEGPGGPGPGGPGFGPGSGGPGFGPGPGGPGVTGTVPVRPGGAVSRPRATFSPKPQYTEMARRARVQGTVILDVIIDAQGVVKDVAVLKTLPMGLDAAAAETVRRWRFEPATLNGRPVDCIMTLTVHFEVQ